MEIPFLEVPEPPFSERLFMYFPTSGPSLQHSHSKLKILSMPEFFISVSTLLLKGNIHPVSLPL